MVYVVMFTQLHFCVALQMRFPFLLRGLVKYLSLALYRCTGLLLCLIRFCFLLSPFSSRVLCHALLENMFLSALKLKLKYTNEKNCYLILGEQNCEVRSSVQHTWYHYFFWRM